MPNKPIFAGEMISSLFVLVKHFGGQYRDVEKTANNSEAGEQTGVAPTLNPLFSTAFLANPGVCR